MKRIFPLLTLSLVCGLVLAGAAFASEAHEGHKEAAPAGVFEHKAVDNGVRAEFQIMSLDQMNMKDSSGATHHVMVRLFHDGMNHPVNEAVGKVKVIDPDNTSQVGDLKNYNGVFAANVSFSAKGKYGVICLVNIDGKKHQFKFWYHYM
jgi:hypothetical protein